MNKKSVTYLVGLAALVLAVSFLLNNTLVGFGTSKNKRQSSDSSSRVISLSKDRFVSRIPGSYIKVIDSENVLDPFIALKNKNQVDDDYVEWGVCFFFRLLRFPKLDFRNLLASKFNSNKKPYPGWAIALRAKEYKYDDKKRKPFSVLLRPEIYFKGSDFGGWSYYDDFEVKRDEWFALIVTFKSGRFITVNRVSLESNAKPKKFLGAYSLLDNYDLEKISTISSYQPLLIGSPFKSNLAASFGLSGVFHGFSSDNISDLFLKHISRKNNFSDVSANDFVTDLKKLAKKINGKIQFITIDGELDMSLNSLKISSNKIAIKKKEK